MQRKRRPVPLLAISWLSELRSAPSPEKRLICAIIVRAISDYLSPRIRHHTPKEWLSAAEYLFSDSLEEFSFRWCLDELDFDDDFYLKIINKISNDTEPTATDFRHLRDFYGGWH